MSIIETTFRNESGGFSTYKLSLETMCNLSSADFKKALKVILADENENRKDENIELIASYFSKYGKQFKLTANMKAFNELTGKTEKETKETKIIKKILKAVKDNDKLKDPFIRNGKTYITNSYIAIETENSLQIPVNPDNKPESFFPDMTAFFNVNDNDYITVTLPDISTIKAYEKETKKAFSCYTLENGCTVKCNLLYTAMLLTGSTSVKVNIYNSFKPIIISGNGYNIVICGMRIPGEKQPGTVYNYESVKTLSGLSCIGSVNVKECSAIEYNKIVIETFDNSITLTGKDIKDVTNKYNETIKNNPLNKHESYHIHFYTCTYSGSEETEEHILSSERYANEKAGSMEYIKSHAVTPEIIETEETEKTEEDNVPVNIAGVDMFKCDAERLVSAKKYIVKSHSVYQIVTDKTGGYKGKRVYKTSKTDIPLVRQGRYLTVDRERVQYMINRAIPDYYSNSVVMTC